MKYNVLIIEDYVDNRDRMINSVKKALAEIEINIDISEWFLDAKKKITKNRYDLVFIDNSLPYENPGWENLTYKDRIMAEMSLAPETEMARDTYKLIDLIRSKNPKSIIIGTSTSTSALKHGNPDIQINKIQSKEEDFQKIIEIMKEKNHKPEE